MSEFYFFALLVSVIAFVAVLAIWYRSKNKDDGSY